MWQRWPFCQPPFQSAATCGDRISQGRRFFYRSHQKGGAELRQRGAERLESGEDEEEQKVLRDAEGRLA